MAIKLRKTVKKFSSTKPAWDELENCIKENCSESIKKLIEAGESQDKIKDTINYFIDHIMEGDSEKKEFSDSISKDQLLNLSSSDTNKFKTAMDSLVSYANGLNEATFDDAVRKVDRKVDSTLKSIFGKLPDPLLVLTYLYKGMHIDWWSLEDLGYTTEDGLDDVYYELAHRAVEDTHKF